jgi:hypothetical protein
VASIRVIEEQHIAFSHPSRCSPFAIIEVESLEIQDDFKIGYIRIQGVTIVLLEHQFQILYTIRKSDTRLNEPTLHELFSVT